MKVYIILIASIFLSVSPFIVSAFSDRVSYECFPKFVRVKFTPLESFKGKIALALENGIPECHTKAGIDEQVVLDIDFKKCTNKSRKFGLFLTEKHRGPKIGNQRRKNTVHGYWPEIDCPIVKTPVDIHNRLCPGKIEKVNGKLVCYDDDV
ncbi:uncharacterized protein LOC130671090 [Microplitis mediator]|uniref:uncharacterized protein LOC130671090 n=1 Tax=Microplitis mediator TaxID=375433 RepID=UPI002552275A|nr:uncharacterized protein LOC130671090 [Microplitis mediator]